MFVQIFFKKYIKNSSLFCRRRLENSFVHKIAVFLMMFHIFFKKYKHKYTYTYKYKYKCKRKRKLSLCSDNRLSENRPLLNMKGAVHNNNNNNNNHVPGPAGGSEKLGSSNQPRHTQGREKRRPSTLMLWEK